MRMRCNSRSGGASITARVLQRILIHHSDSIPSSAASSLPRVQPHSSATLVVEPEVMLELRKEIQRFAYQAMEIINFGGTSNTSGNDVFVPKNQMTL